MNENEPERELCLKDCGNWGYMGCAACTIPVNGQCKHYYRMSEAELQERRDQGY